jgi:hypothetical protein
MKIETPEPGASGWRAAARRFLRTEGEPKAPTLSRPAPLFEPVPRTQPLTWQQRQLERTTLPG